ncbi:MAG: hypothetical protein EA385_16735 [Salinarimonadaceae bacterium]|nr:MAG: hypothetical protein EA385_16735 [Salinarimonadaceae bacterium]
MTSSETRPTRRAVLSGALSSLSAICVAGAPIISSGRALAGASQPVWSASSSHVIDPRDGILTAPGIVTFQRGAFQMQGIARGEFQRRAAFLDAVFSPDGTRFVASTGIGIARKWRLPGRDAERFRAEETDTFGSSDESVGAINAIKWSNDGRLIMYAEGWNLVRFFAADDLHYFGSVFYRGVVGCDFSDDSQNYMLFSNHSIDIFDLNDRKTHSFPTAPIRSPVVKAVLVGGVSKVATLHDNGVVAIWDASSGSILQHFRVRVQRGGQGISGAIDVTRQGKALVASMGSATAVLWDIEKEEKIMVLEGHEDIITMANFSRDGRFIVTSSFDNSAKIWETDSGNLVRNLPGHRESVLSARFSHDGWRILTTSRDRTARLWTASG